MFKILIFIALFGPDPCMNGCFYTGMRPQPEFLGFSDVNIQATFETEELCTQAGEKLTSADGRFPNVRFDCVQVK